MNVALIGTRRAAAHARWLAAAPGLTLVGVAYDTDEQAAVRLASGHPAAEVTADALSLVKREDVDMVVVATPPRAHEEIVALALHRDLRVVCETPLAADRTTALRLSELAELRGARAYASFPWRHNEALCEARSWILRADVGEILAVDMTLHDDSHLGPGTRWSWRQRLGEGGALMELAPHLFDLLRWMTGVSAWDVSSAWTHRLSDMRHGPHGRSVVEVDDMAQVELTAFGQVTRARVMASRVCPERSLQLVFTGGKGILRVTADPTDGSATLTLKTGSRSVQRLAAPDRMNPYTRLDDDDPSHTRATFDDGLLALRTAHAALALATLQNEA
ncbi:Gfo/Idh/MocA family oxidoreductase [Streptomyces sp. NPDC096057]|uniref:Gfo/Idh/MocA family protein n=1 Tax=Streptomyces sp. NPDC096057 TaxID=3155543 RepID=UPI003326028E